MYFLYNTHIIHILKCKSKFKILNLKNMRKFIQKILKNIFSILIFFKTDFQYFYKEYFESFKKNFEILQKILFEILIILISIFWLNSLWYNEKISFIILLTFLFLYIKILYIAISFFTNFFKIFFKEKFIFF